MKKYNWGIIGLGKIAKKFAADLLLLENANLYGVASRSMQKAEDFATEFSVAHAYGDYLTLIQDENVDVIYIATPHAFHHEQTILCLKNNKAVLCEKPMSTSLENVKLMVDEARRSNVFLMEAMWTAFLPHFQYVQDIVVNKEFGEVLSIHSDFGFKANYDPDKRLYNKKLGGGSLLDIGVYPVFGVLSLLGMPSEIKAMAKFSDTGIDEEMRAILKYEDKAVATVESSLKSTTPTELVVYLEEATIKILRRWHEPTNVQIIKDGKTKEIEFETKGIGYLYEAKEVMSCLDKQMLESPKMNWKKSIHLAQIIDQIKKEVNLYY